MLTIVRLLFIALIGYFGYSYYALVMPASLAMIICWLIVGALLITLLVGQMAMDFIVRGGLTIVCWPAGTFIATWVAEFFGFHINATQAMALAPLTAGIAAMVAYSMSEKRDRARDLATLSLSTIVLYTMLQAISSTDHNAITMACFSVATAAFVMKQMLIIPPEQETGLKIMIVFPLISMLISFIF